MSVLEFACGFEERANVQNAFLPESLTFVYVGVKEVYLLFVCPCNWFGAKGWPHYRQVALCKIML